MYPEIKELVAWILIKCLNTRSFENPPNKISSFISSVGLRKASIAQTPKRLKSDLPVHDSIRVDEQPSDSLML